MKLRRRLSWGLADQAFSSITNFGLTVFVSANVSAREFGAFSLAYAVYGTCLGVSAGLASVPLIVRFSAAEPEDVESAATQATGTALVIGFACAVPCLLAVPFMSDSLRPGLLALALVLPGLLLQDAWRQAFMARGLPRSAAVNDLVWTGLQAVGMGLLLATGLLTVSWLVLVWGGAAWGAAVYGGMQARRWPSLRSSRSWLRDHRDLGPRYAVENVAHRAGPSLALALIGLVAGLAALGALRGAMLLVMGPLNLVFVGAVFVAGPEAVRLAHKSVSRLRRIMLLLSAIILVAALSWTVIVVAFAGFIGPTLLGDTWPLARPLLPILAVFALSLAISMGASQGLLALGAARRSAATQLAAVALLCVFGTTGAAAGGGRGAALGMVLGSMVSVALRWWQFQRALDEKLEQEEDRGIEGRDAADHDDVEGQAAVEPEVQSLLGRS